MGFLSQWKMYLDQMPENQSENFTGKKLDPTVFEKVCGDDNDIEDLSDDLIRLVHRCHQNNWGSCTKLCTQRKAYGNLWKLQIRRMYHEAEEPISNTQNFDMWTHSQCFDHVFLC